MSRSSHRLRQRSLPGWRLAAVGVFVAAGALFVTSSLDADGLDLRASGVSDLDTVVRQERARVDGLQTEVSSLTRDVDRLGRDVDDDQVRQLRAEVETMRAAAGFAPVRGPAVTVVLDDTPDERADALIEGGVAEQDLVVHQQDLQAVVNALWQGEAEAMTLQSQRVISTTGIKCVGNTVVLHGVPYAPPYVITAVGDPSELLDALDANDYVAGYRTYVEAYDLGYDVSTQASVDLPGYQGAAELRHATAVTPDTGERS